MSIRDNTFKLTRKGVTTDTHHSLAQTEKKNFCAGKRVAGTQITPTRELQHHELYVVIDASSIRGSYDFENKATICCFVKNWCTAIAAVVSWTMEQTNIQPVQLFAHNPYTQITKKQKPPLNCLLASQVRKKVKRNGHRDSPRVVDQRVSHDRYA